MSPTLSTNDGVHLGPGNEAVTDESSDEALGNSESTRKEFLFTESKIADVFDLLAEKINRHLDYSELLAEDGLQGLATLDLYFDREGRVDETKSRFLGSNRYLRGVLVRAARKGLVEWGLSDASRLKKDQFRNQHFRADFELSHLLRLGSELQKTMPNSYRFIRAKTLNYVCLGGQPGDGTPYVDFACLLAVASGALKKTMSSEYRMRLQALKDTLEEFDERGIAGVNALIGAKA